jgi:hypothetical protein
MISYQKKRESREKFSLAGEPGVSPRYSQVPQDWGIQGVHGKVESGSLELTY